MDASVGTRLGAVPLGRPYAVPLYRLDATFLDIRDNALCRQTVIVDGVNTVASHSVVYLLLSLVAILSKAGAAKLPLAQSLNACGMSRTVRMLW